MAYKLSRLYGRSQKNHRLQRVNNVCGSFKSHTHCIRSFRMVNTHMLTGTGIERRTFASFFAITTLFYICRYPYIYIICKWYAKTWKYVFAFKYFMQISRKRLILHKIFWRTKLTTTTSMPRRLGPVPYNNTTATRIHHIIKLHSRGNQCCI